MLIAGSLRGDLQTIAAQNGTTTALATLLDTLEAFDGVVWLCTMRRPGGWIYTVEWQTRVDERLTTTREAWLDTSTWAVGETPTSPRPRTPVSTAMETHASPCGWCDGGPAVRGDACEECLDKVG